LLRQIGARWSVDVINYLILTHKRKKFGDSGTEIGDRN